MIPVLLNLSTWKNDHQPIADWLVDQLNLKYGVEHEISKNWLKTNQLLLLLDGLNELTPDRQELCIQAINQLLQSFKGSLHLMICANLKEYKNCHSRFQLKGVIRLRPLNKKQIRDYLIEVRRRELWENIQDDLNLLDLAKTPLLLNVMVLAYEEILIHSWKRFESEEERLRYLLNAYIRRELNREISQPWYEQGQEPSLEQTRAWLAWLAQRMKADLSEELVIDQLPASWLQTPTDVQIYELGRKLIKSLALALVTCVIFGLLSGLMLGIIIGLIAGIIGILIPSIPSIDNLTLRLILAWRGYIPWNYERFLNYATQRLMLQHSDRSYRFIHPLLQEHFAKTSAD